mgnify:CR=1 FL=1
MLRREGYHIKTVDCVNIVIPGRTRAEHYEDNKDKLLENRKLYYQANKAKIQEYKKQKHNCECGGKYRTSDKSKHLKTAKHKKYEQN